MALAARLLYVSLVEPVRVQSDASGYDAAARRLGATGTYAFPLGKALWSDDVFREDAWAAYLRMPSNAWSMPGYSGFLAFVYRLSGPGRYGAVRLVQALLGAATLALIFFVADAALGRRAAWMALGLNALYPPSYWAATYLLTETLFTLLLVAQVALMVWAARSRRVVAYAVLGLATAAAVYVRPMAALVPALLIACEAHRWFRDPAPRQSLRRHAVRFAVLAMVVVALMAPWWMRNMRLYGVFMPTTSAAALPAAQGELILRRLPVPDESYAQSALPALTGYDDRVYATLVARQIRATMPPASPVDLAAARLSQLRMLGYALFSPFNFFSERYPMLSWQVAMQVAILAFGLVGLWRNRRRPEATWLVAAVAAYVVLVHWQLSMLLSRYLYPAMPLVLALAGAGIEVLLPGGRR
ncbi:MAG TPA: glycosyltransferase family 39 protein, partial [Candidatus Limnocylindrales bacterium]|nr:glycosyltransferase family 39 protein [Candidatus Limnocylindrales bacterium]